MSSGAECEIVERKPGEWWYMLQAPGTAFDAWDWREEAIVDGPFASADQAWASLRSHHVNPGGHVEVAYTPGAEAFVLERLIFAKQHKIAPRFSISYELVETMDDGQRAWYVMLDRLDALSDDDREAFGPFPTKMPLRDMNASQIALAYLAEHHPHGKHLGGGSFTPYESRSHDWYKAKIERLSKIKAQAPDAEVLAQIIEQRKQQEIERARSRTRVAPRFYR